MENALAEPGVSEESIQSLVDRRILRREERGGLVRLELIHDVLAIVAKASRDARREAAALEAAQQLLAKQRRRQRIAVVWAAVLVAVLIAVSALAVFAIRRRNDAVRAQLIAVSSQQQADQQAQRAIEQQKLAQSESARALSAEQLAKSKQLQLAVALEKADVATGKATSEAAEKEKERWRAVIWAAAADEQLDAHGTGEQVRACLDSTNRLADDPASPSLDYMVGIWHADAGGSSTNGSSTDMDWRSDGTCAFRHVYQGGQEYDLHKDVCTWKYKPVAGHADEFELDWASKLLGPEYPKQLIFKIVSRTRMRNINIGYDAFRIVCPVQEITIRRGELAALQKQADADPGNLMHQVDLANGFDKLGTALAAQGDSANAVVEFNAELNVYQNLASRDPANLAWQRSAAQLFERIGDRQLAQAKAFNQAGDAQHSLQQSTSAIASYQKNLAIRQQLLHAAPEDVDAQLNAAHAFSQLAIALYWSNHRPEATNAVRDTVRLLQNIVDTHRGTPHVRVQLLWSLYYLSVMSGDATEERDDLRKSLAIATELDSKHEDPEEMSGVVGFLQGALAKLH